MTDSRIEIHYRQRAIAPFWEKLPFFFRFPFRPGPLIFIACIVAASAVVGLMLGAFGMLLKGMLVYLGLRYGFNVLDLFAKGRFEGESVDHTLWGPELRPAKLGIVIVLFIVLGVVLGNWAVGARIDKDPAAQQIVLDRFKREHATEMAALARQREAYYKRLGLESAPAVATAIAGDTSAPPDDADNRPTADIANSPALTDTEQAQAAAAAAAAAEIAEYGRPRADILRGERPDVTDPLWLRLLPGWYWLVMVALSFLLPSAALVIAIDDEFFKSLNPLFVPHFIRAMGSAYFVLWVFLLSIVGLRQWLLSIGENWPTVLRLPVEMALGSYLGLVLCALLGYTLYQFHQELHLDVEVDFDTHRKAGGVESIAAAGSARAAVDIADPQDALGRRVQALLATGRIEEAIAEVKDEMRYDRLDADLNTRLHDLYLRLHDKEQTLAHGQQWMKAMARAGRARQGLAGLRKLIAIDAGFTVQDSDATLALADAAVRQGDRDLAIALLRGFDTRFPDHKDLPLALFLAARLTSEHGRQHDKAAQMLRLLLSRHPDHAIAAEARSYLGVLEGMPRPP